MLMKMWFYFIYLFIYLPYLSRYDAFPPLFRYNKYRLVHGVSRGAYCRYSTLWLFAAKHKSHFVLTQTRSTWQNYALGVYTCGEAAKKSVRYIAKHLFNINSVDEEQCMVGGPTVGCKWGLHDRGFSYITVISTQQSPVYIHTIYVSGINSSLTDIIAAKTRV